MKAYYILFLGILSLKFAYGQCSDIEIINQKKTAIVIGQKNYKYTDPLKNTLNDATDISDSLKRLQFEVFTYSDLDKITMNKVIDEWCTSLKGKKYDIALFYYSGHGAEVESKNYIIPVDFKPIAATDLKYDGYEVSKVLDRMESNVSVSVVILDACRNNPFPKEQSKSFTPLKGLARMEGNSSFIGYATKPGDVASDGNRRNGIYTEAILKNITVPNLTLKQIFTRINKYVRNATDESQIPYEHSSLSLDPCFRVVQKISRPPVISASDKDFAYTTKSLLHKISLGSAAEYVIKFELGENSNSMPYEKLPRAIECTNQNVKFICIYLNQSRQKLEVYSFLNNHGLRDLISEDSYIVYYFSNNKLGKITLRLFPKSNNLKKMFVSSLGLDFETTSDKYKVEVEGIHYILGSSFYDISSLELTICNSEGYNICIHDWWYNL